MLAVTPIKIDKMKKNYHEFGGVVVKQLKCRKQSMRCQRRMNILIAKIFKQEIL